jgi:hypothetical protein
VRENKKFQQLSELEKKILRILQKIISEEKGVGKNG